MFLVVTYALADRFTGGGAPGLDARLPGRSIAWATAAAGLVGYLIAPPLAFLALVWGIYRSLPFEGLGGSLTPRTPAALLATVFRHALPVLAAPVVGLSFIPWALAYAVTATALGAWLGRQVDTQGRDPNAVVELLRGAAFGLALIGWRWGV